MTILTIENLCAEASLFSATESSHPEPLLYGVTDGKAIGTYLEQKFKLYLKDRYNFVQGNSASGIYFSGILVDVKVTSIKQPQSSSCATYKIDAKKYFDATVDACLLVCRFDRTSKNYFCDVFDTLGSLDSHRIGYRHNILIRDTGTFDRLSKLYDLKSGEKWRSGIKHDCSSVMEFRKINGIFINGLGESVDIEETYLFPLLKGSDIAENRTMTTDRYVLVPQRFVGESTDRIKDLAPNTWAYLELHEPLLKNRKSKIYSNNPRFSIFGVGVYTFRPWKIAICGLYKKLAFRLIGTLDDKTTIFDDTVYFLSFDNEETALATFTLLTSQFATDFYSSLIFWDEKRPIKSSVLNSLNLTALTEVISMLSNTLALNCSRVTN